MNGKGQLVGPIRPLLNTDLKTGNWMTHKGAHLPRFLPTGKGAYITTHQEKIAGYAGVVNSVG